MVYFISDTHFGHRNIIRYSNRPYETVGEMDGDLIKNWNDTISPNDVVYHLGDFCLRGVDYTQNVVNQLNGTKKILLGNHDRTSVTFWKRMGFDEVFKEPVVRDNYILSHEPIDNPDRLNIHGHTHTLKAQSIMHIPVCVEMIGYKPISIDDLMVIHTVLISNRKNWKTFYRLSE